MAIELGYGPGSQPYTTVMPQDGNQYMYDKDGVRYQVPIGFKGGNIGGQEFTLKQTPAMTPQPSPKASTTREQQVSAIQQAIPSTQTSTSALTQATTAAQMVQPTLPSGTAISPELQQVRAGEIQTTPIYNSKAIDVEDYVDLGTWDEIKRLLINEKDNN